MNNYFTNLTAYSKVKINKTAFKANLENIISTFQNHESAQRIKLTNKHSKYSLKFENVTKKER